jgi:HD-GYP domain-containing protein (c-di-GMP phosphodiesterase class II)
VPEVYLAELLAALSLTADLGMGQPMEHCLRQCLVASQLGDELGLERDDRDAVFYSGLMAWVGCHVDAYEQTKWFGDEFGLKANERAVDLKSNASEMAFTVRNLYPGAPLAQKARAALGLMAGGMKDAIAMLENHSLAVNDLAVTLGLDDNIRRSIDQTFERWDGRGPDGAKGEEIAVTSRLVNLADVVVFFERAGGVDAACDVARERSGTQFDPAMVDVFCDHAHDIFEAIDAVPTWDAVIQSEPALRKPLTAAEFDNALEAIADFADVKSPFTAGHSRGVADLAGDAAKAVGLKKADAINVRRAGLLHDLGRLGVPNTIWDKQGELTLTESERVRMHPYLTERTLASSPALAPLGVIAIQHHERLDGSGYPRGLKGDALSLSGRVLGAADAYHSKIEPRPHRPAVKAAEAAALLRAEVREGRLDGEAVEAVLESAGHRTRRRQTTLGGLTERELDVLRLLARGLATNQIAHELGISGKTAGNHVEHIYSKLGVSNRAMATLFAAKHGLLDAEG